MKLGIIAEDYSDVAIVREMTLTLLRPHVVGFRPFVGGGCGKLRHKCAAWAKILVEEGHSSIMVIHDLDLRDRDELHAELSGAIGPAQRRTSVVLLPKHEIEAWLLYDWEAIAAAFRENRRLPLPGNPESILDPKKHLRDLIRRRYHKNYLNTVHNGLIAKHIDTRLLRSSRSFSPHFAFASTVRQMLR